MKRFLLIISLLVSIGTFSQSINKIIPPKPNPPRLVNDFAHILSPDQVMALEQKLVAYDDSTSVQITVVTIDTLYDYAIDDVALQILRQWGVGGQAQKDNGAVLLISRGNRKVSISTGYGLEGSIPDITAKTIIETDIVPHFKAGNYYRGLDAGTNSMIEAVAGEYKAPANYRKKGNNSGGLSIGKLIIGFIILLFIMNMFGGGGRSGGMMSRRGYRGFGGPVFIPGGFGGSSGGFGGGGGGGFGGFGGGSGGGGGASGDW